MLREIVLGWGKGRIAKYEMFQPKIQKGLMLLLSHRAFGFNMVVQVGTLVCALCFGGQFEGDLGQSEGRGAG
jgi:hypothetical protein